MKLSAVYKSKRKADTYLYVAKKDDFSNVPEALMKQFGVPMFVMLVPVQKRKTIANIDTKIFIEKLEQDGFYLQLPPKPENLLETHQKSLKGNASHKAKDE